MPDTIEWVVRWAGAAAVAVHLVAMFVGIACGLRRPPLGSGCDVGRRRAAIGLVGKRSANSWAKDALIAAESLTGPGW